jgi:hypothetical protein
MTRRPRLGLLLLAALTVVAVLLARGGDGGPGPPPPLRSGELPADDLVDSIGVVVHFNYTDTAYGRQAEVLARLRELGVRHVRDAMPAPGSALAAGLRAAAAAGIRGTLATGDIAREPALAVADALRAVGPGAIAAFEGPNEIDKSPDPAWPAVVQAYMPKLAEAVRGQAPGVPVVGPSFVDPGLSRARLPPDLPGLVNGHPYPGGGPPEPALGDELRRSPPGSVRRGIVFTETGYHNALASTGGQPPASEQAAAIYLPRLLVTAFGAGVRRTFLYELLDEVADPAGANSEWHFGLVRADLSPKPAFTAIRTLIGAVRASPGRGRRGPLRWRLRAGSARDVERLTLVRRDGSRVIALWRPVSVWDQQARQPLDPPPLPVELFFAFGARDVTVWRPSVSAQPVLRRRSAGRLRLALGGDLVLVSLR